MLILGVLLLRDALCFESIRNQMEQSTSASVFYLFLSFATL